MTGCMLWSSKRQKPIIGLPEQQWSGMWLTNGRGVQRGEPVPGVGLFQNPLHPLELGLLPGQVIGDGSLDIINEAEIPAIIYQTFTALGLKRFRIRVNNRKGLKCSNPAPGRWSGPP